MSSLSGEQAVASRRASLETLSDVRTKAFGCIEKLTELNLRAIKSTLAKFRQLATMALPTKAPQELIALHAKRTQAADGRSAVVLAAHEQHHVQRTSRTGRER
jgi:hypothetical protein